MRNTHQRFGGCSVVNGTQRRNVWYTLLRVYKSYILGRMIKKQGRSMRDFRSIYAQARQKAENHYNSIDASLGCTSYSGRTRIPHSYFLS